MQCVHFVTWSQFVFEERLWSQTRLATHFSEFLYKKKSVISVKRRGDVTHGPVKQLLAGQLVATVF